MQVACRGTMFVSLYHRYCPACETENSVYNYLTDLAATAGMGERVSKFSLEAAFVPYAFMHFVQVAVE